MKSNGIIYAAVGLIAVMLMLGSIQKESFIPSPYPRVMLADGGCRGRHQAMADFVYSRYPFYQAHSYFKPLEFATASAMDNIILDDTPKTTLYTVYN
jgi:hypothetical protein